MSKNPNTMMIRYMGTDENRRFVIQRADNKFWTGEGWSKILDSAKVFNDHKTAQTTVQAIQRAKWKGKPCRTFKVEMTVTLVGDKSDEVTEKELQKFLADAVRIDVETSVYGDGPGNNFVQARMNLTTLEETEGKKVF